MGLNWRKPITQLNNLFKRSFCRENLYRQWEESAEQGNQEARYRLASLYPKEKKYYPLAFKWTLSLAKHGGNTGVMLQAAKMYRLGHGTSRDDEQALLWLERTLSLHILQGKKSPLSRQKVNSVEQEIQYLRSKIGWK